jgi:hypothetical protein
LTLRLDSSVAMGDNIDQGHHKLVKMVCRISIPFALNCFVRNFLLPNSFSGFAHFRSLVIDVSDAMHLSCFYYLHQSRHTNCDIQSMLWTTICGCYSTENTTRFAWICIRFLPFLVSSMFEYKTYTRFSWLFLDLIFEKVRKQCVSPGVSTMECVYCPQK